MLEGQRGLRGGDVCMLVWVLAVWGQLGERYVLRGMQGMLDPLRTPEVSWGWGGLEWDVGRVGGGRKWYRLLSAD